MKMCERVSYLFKDRLVVVHIVHSYYNLRCGGQCLRPTRGVVISGCNIKDIFHTLQARGWTGAQSDQTYNQTATGVV